jgi:hypothetical protein
MPKHLFDGKGTYDYIVKPNDHDLILEDVTRRLKNLLSDCLLVAVVGKEFTTKPLAQTLTKWADD